jgi:hypothetical protein
VRLADGDAILDISSVADGETEWSMLFEDEVRGLGHLLDARRNSSHQTAQIDLYMLV